MSLQFRKREKKDITYKGRNLILGDEETDRMESLPGGIGIEKEK
jgi:hypothetical protein